MGESAIKYNELQIQNRKLQQNYKKVWAKIWNIWKYWKCIRRSQDNPNISIIFKEVVLYEHKLSHYFLISLMSRQQLSLIHRCLVYLPEFNIARAWVRNQYSTRAGSVSHISNIEVSFERKLIFIDFMHWKQPRS